MTRADIAIAKINLLGQEVPYVTTASEYVFDGGVYLSIIPLTPDTIRIHHIWANEKIGAAFVGKILEIADSLQVSVEANPEPFYSIPDIVSWYQSLGFEYDGDVVVRRFRSENTSKV